MTQIPSRILEVWNIGVDIEQCATLIKTQKLLCSKCGTVCDSELPFKHHVNKCLRGAEKTRDYLVHMYCNRLIILQNRYSLYCNVPPETEFKKCGVCSEKVSNYAELKQHMKQCKDFDFEYGKFLAKTKMLFDSLMVSYDALGDMLQKFKNDREIIRIRDSPVSKPIYNSQGLVYYPEQMQSDPLVEYFLEKSQNFYSSLVNFTRELFVRYLRKQELKIVDEYDYLQRDPYANFPTLQDDEDDTDTDSSGDEEEEEDVEEEDYESDDIEVYLDDDVMDETSGSASRSHEYYQVDGMNADDDDDEIIDVVGLDEDTEPVEITEFDYQYEDGDEDGDEEVYDHEMEEESDGDAFIDVVN